MKSMNLDSECTINLNGIRRAKMYGSTECPKIVQGNVTTWDVAAVGCKNLMDAKDCDVLKQDSRCTPIWWRIGGINFCWYGAASMDEAKLLYSAVTESPCEDLPETFFITGRYGGVEFRLHR